MEHPTSGPEQNSRAVNAQDERIPAPKQRLSGKGVLRNWALMLTGFVAIAMLAQWVSG